MRLDFTKLSRREIFKLSMMAGSATLIGTRSALGQKKTGGNVSCHDLPPMPYDIENETGALAIEAFPMSPFILHPFSDALPVPTAMKPGYRQIDGTLTPNDPQAWFTRQSTLGKNTVCRPGPGAGMQDAMGARRRTAGTPGPSVPDAGTHQLWTDGSGVSGTTNGINVPGFPLLDPILYHIRVQANKGKVTSSDVQPIGKTGLPIQPPGNVQADGSLKYFLPDTMGYTFGNSGTFPGPMINAEYGHPVLVRFENDLDLNPENLDRQDFGAPDWAFLTHLHNGHTAPESDGQPHHMSDNKGGYQPGQWTDNLYLNYPAGNDPNEMQSFFWFHDHRMHHTGANVYKGMVGLFPIYDPLMDNGDETTGYRLPGVRVNNLDGTFDVKYDIPMGLYDVLLDDGTTQHQDYHNGCGELHPEWWGKKFFRHFPDHGFVGDIFTINGVAYPRLDVFQRQYRFRFLGASVSRDYELMLMKGTPAAAPGTQGQWQIPDGQECMKWTQVASEGGLLPKAISRDSVQIWPSKRREMVVDFTKYADGSPTSPGDVVYLVNVLQMPDGRKPLFNPAGATRFPYKVPMMKIVIGGAPPEPDRSMPVADLLKANLRPKPQYPSTANANAKAQRTFTLNRGTAINGETQWVINGLEFNLAAPLATPRRGTGEVWNIINGGAGWTHPMHFHMEEHTVLKRTGSINPHPDDTGKEDVVGLDPGEQVLMYRRFRTFAGNYVAHCHNLAHEDHNMMFGWSIIP
jgi:FtsP/CotA-like multicopper oxidase with cupredoxin domain